MLFKIELQEHHGHEVWTNTTMDTLRKLECLCLNCGCANFASDDPARCYLNEDLFDICEKNSIALAVTRCPNFCFNRNK